MDYQGFKYRNDECEELARLLRTEGYAQAEMDDEDEMDIFLRELEILGVYRIEDADEDMEALDSDEEPLFYTRLVFTDTADAGINELDEEKIWTIDFFYAQGESEIFYGDDDFF
ncbi:MAG: hypothetical protein II359_00240 [Clostridia bacterium]|nr:hypothetical protein [Clostridia bacterium]